MNNHKQFDVADSFSIGIEVADYNLKVVCILIPYTIIYFIPYMELRKQKQ